MIRVFTTTDAAIAHMRGMEVEADQMLMTQAAYIKEQRWLKAWGVLGIVIYHDMLMHHPRNKRKVPVVQR